MAEAQRVQEENDRQEKEKRLKLIEELKSEAIELGTLQKNIETYLNMDYDIANWEQRRHKT